MDSRMCKTVSLVYVLFGIKLISSWCHLTVQTALCVLYRGKLNFTQLYLTGGEHLVYCAYYRILLKCNLKFSVCVSVECAGLNEDWVSQIVDQFIDLSKDHAMYIQQFSGFWRTALHNRCVLPPAHIQLSTLMAHRWAQTQTHTHKTYKRCVKIC